VLAALPTRRPRQGEDPPWQMTTPSLGACTTSAWPPGSGVADGRGRAEWGRGCGRATQPAPAGRQRRLGPLDSGESGRDRRPPRRWCGAACGQQGPGGRPAGVATATVTKTALAGLALGATAYARVLGAKLEQAEDVPVEGGTTPTSSTPDRAAKAQRQLTVLQWAIPALTGATLAVNARMGEQQRPSRSRAGCLGPLGAGYPRRRFRSWARPWRRPGPSASVDGAPRARW
jgi:hypothetical protein